MKNALICGISGQDGAYLARFLLGKGYQVYGTSRDAQIAPLKNLKELEIRDKVSVESMAPNDFRSVLQTLVKIEPTEIYYLAGQTSVGLSFQQPVETLESISVSILNILEALRFTKLPTRLYNACSSECFGDTKDIPADEMTPFRPRSPYAVAKAAAYWELANYREAYGLKAYSGILFNHESPLRPERFVTKKIVASACRIAANKQKQLFLGNLSIQRDWGWAPEYVEAMWKILQTDHPDDYVIATGESYRLEDFVDTVFSYLGLDWHQYVKKDKTLFRPTELMYGRANPAKAAKVLGWKAQYQMHDVAKMMVDAEMKSYSVK